MSNDREKWSGNMVCPFFVDFTRMCIDKIPILIEFTTHKTCNSEQYVDCPVYLVCTSSFNCEYFSSCGKQYNEKIPKLLMDIFMTKTALENLKDIWMNYCLSPENSKTCAKYKLYSKGEKPSVYLMPDGGIMSSFDFIFKRKLIIHPPE
jgi:hypothetical protein